MWGMDPRLPPIHAPLSRTHGPLGNASRIFPTMRRPTPSARFRAPWGQEGGSRRSHGVDPDAEEQERGAKRELPGLDIWVLTHPPRLGSIRPLSQGFGGAIILEQWW
jgi:hypothetical protein